TISNSATLDCDAPQLVGNVQLLSVTDTTATIGLTTNEPVTGSVFVATSCPAADISATLAPDGMGGYTASFAGLAEGTQYFFQAEVEDAAGNAATFDAGGACHQFYT